jgi:hypothetical protein
MSETRRREAHRKFLLGGLVVRASLAEADRAFLLGALIEAGRLAAGSDQHERLKAIGLEAFRRQPVEDAPAPDQESEDVP